MKKRTKYLVTAAAAMAMLLGCASVSYASGTTTTRKTGWEEITVDREKEWVYYKDGKMVKSDWVCSPASGIWYYMDSNGYMITDCWGSDRNSEGYWFDASGAMATGWRTIALEDDEDAGRYGPGSSSQDEKGYFYFNSSGMVCEGWLNLNGTYYYLNDGYVDGFADYQMVYGLAEIDGEEYYFGEASDGSMKRGKVKVTTEENSNTPSSSSTDHYYLFQDNGIRVTDGWGRYNGTWYYLDDEGEIVTEGFLYLDKSDDMVDEDEADYVYYMDKNGVMKTGWLEIGEEKEVRPGEVKAKSYYYFKSSGPMWTGWLNEGGTYYYLREEAENGYSKGELVTGLYTVDKDTYYFDKNGSMAASAWREVEDDHGEKHSIYLGTKGAMVRGTAPGSLAFQTVKGKTYFFDTDGYCIDTKNAIVVKKDDKYELYSRGNGTEAELKADSSYAAGTVYYVISSNGSAKKSVKK